MIPGPKESPRRTRSILRGMQSRPSGLVRHIGGLVHTDVPASIVVFLVAIPLSLGIAIASGAPLVAGLIAAVVGGIVAGALGGSVLGVSGPAAGLTVIVADLVMRFGWSATCAITLCAGFVQIVLGSVRVGRAVLVVSPAVMHGMLAAIGITVALAQLHIVLGGSPQSSALANIADLPSQLAHNHSGAVAIGVLTMALLLGWPWLRVRLGRLGVIPGPLVAVAAATAVAGVLAWNVPRVNLPDQLLTSWQFPTFSVGGAGPFAVAVLTVALVASVESLLSALAVDRMHEGRRAQLNRELVGQGSANVVSGALGGLPITGVIMRSSVNVAAGAKSRYSAVLHGVWVLVFALAFSPLIEQIPLAALAALLVFVGLQMIKISHIRHLHHHREIPIYVATLAGVVIFNLVEGVIIGICLALLMAFWRLTRCSVTIENEDDRWHVIVQGSLTFLAVPKLSRALAEVPAQASVDLDLNVDFMDHAAFETIHHWRQSQERLGGQVDIDELHEDWYARGTTGSVAAHKSAPGIAHGWWAPWAHRQRQEPENPIVRMSHDPKGADTPEEPLLIGAREFHRRTAPLVRPLLTRMAHKQSPSQLFITCADSRIVPNLITASGPGDLFTLRNIGNFVPVHGRGHDQSVPAAIEYAIGVLGVRSITVCGHSDCGAMKALLLGKQDLGGTLSRWLDNGAASLARLEKNYEYCVRDAHCCQTGSLHHRPTGRRHEISIPVLETVPSLPTLSPADQLSVLNVAQQVENALTYPLVSKAVNDGKLQVVGMFFSIDAARLYLLDATTSSLIPIPDRSRARLSPEEPVT